MGIRSKETKLLALEEYRCLIKNLRYVVKLRGHSYRELAELLGVSVSLLLPLLSEDSPGHSGLSHASTAQIARGLGFPVRDLLYTDLEARDKCFF